jgi:O-antigen ligase
LSLNPYATLGSFLALLPAAAVFLVVSRFNLQQQVRLVYIILVAAAGGAILGALQKASGGDGIWSVLSTPHAANGPGLFVNRNHQAAFLLLAMPLAAAASRVRASTHPGFPGWLIALGLLAVYAGGVVATTSRMGLALLPLAAFLSILILFPFRLTVARFGLTVVAVVLIGFGMWQTSGVRAVLRRPFENDIRFEYWSDAWIAAQRFWSSGSGFGTFQEVYAAFENLNIVVEAYPYNAHNDYLELAIEGGILAVSLVLVGLIVLAYHLLQLSKQESLVKVCGLGAMSGVLLVLINSTVDYPLRMPALMTVFALLCSLGVQTPSLSSPVRSRSAL